MKRINIFAGLIILLLIVFFLPLGLAYAQNIALSATATSSGGGVGAFGPGQINNNITEAMDSTQYHWVTAGATSWVELTWSSTYIIDVVWVDTNGTQPFAPAEVQYWNGLSWVTVGDRSGATNDWVLMFGRPITDRIRFYNIGGIDPRIFEIEVYEPAPTSTPSPTISPTPTMTGTFTSTPTDTLTPTPVGTWYSNTPTPTMNCAMEAGFFEPWSTCENLRGPIPGSSSYVWTFDDCDYCRVPGNPCFTVPCTFAMYVVSSCGRDFHVPLWDNETGNIQIKSCLTNNYMFLRASSTGGWNATGTYITWQDCGGMDPRWNNQTTDVMFTDPVALCGVYRIEFIDWGGFIWDLYANCTGRDEPGFLIYDNYADAAAVFTPLPELVVSNILVTGTCPNFTVGIDVSNFGCDVVDAPVCVDTSLGGHWEFTLPGIISGETRFGSTPIVAPSCSSSFTITVTVDCNNIVRECTEVMGSGCNPSGVGSNTDEFFYEVPYTPTHTFTSIFTNTPTPTSTSTPTAPPTIFCCWEPAVNAGPVLNSIAQDWHPNLASDNMTLYYASARTGGWGKSDLWVSTRIGPGPEDWSAPVNLGTNINTSQLEAAPSISHDMHELFFEAYNFATGTIDIFQSTWDVPLAQWSKRKPLSSVINTSDYDERHPLILRDDRTLYFDTNRAGGHGDYDIWFTQRYRGRWTEPEPLPIPVNSSAYEAAPYIYYYPGGQQLYYETTRLGSNQLFVCEWNSVLMEWEPPNRMCLAFLNALFPSINVGGREMLYHATGGYGSYDIWLSECQPSPTPKGSWFSPTPTVTNTVKPVVGHISSQPSLVLLILLSTALCLSGICKHLFCR